MARYLTSGVVVLADDHPHAQGTIDAARAFAGHRYAVGHDGDARFGGFDEVVDPGRDQPTVAATFKEAARRGIPWVALRRDLAPPAELLGQLLEATARRTSKELPGFVVLLTGPEKRRIRRILAVVDRSDGQPSGLMILAAVAAAEQTGAAVDVLVIGAPHEELDSSLRPDELLRVTRDRDLFEQAQRRSEHLGARGHWMFIDHVDSRIQLIRDVLAAQEYDLLVEDLGDVNLGGRMGRHKRIDRALRKGGPASITVAVLKKTDLPVLLVLDAIRLGLVPAKVKVGAGASVLALGVMVSAAPKAAAGPAQRERMQTSISQTVSDYDDALSEAAALAAPASVAAAHEQAQESGSQAAAMRGDTEATTDADQAADEDASDETTSDEASDEAATDEAQAAEQATDEGSSDEGSSDEATAAEAEEAPADDDSSGLRADEDDVTSLAELNPEDVTPEKAPKADADEVDVPDDLSHNDVDKAEKAAAKSKDALDEAKDDFDKAQEAAVEAKDDAVDASAKSVEASSALTQANDAYEQVSAEAEDVIADATGVSGAVPGGATAADMAQAEASQAEALSDLEEAGAQADSTLEEYQEAATEAVEASAELDQAAQAVTDAQAEYNQDKAKAQAYDEAYHEAMADSRVSPVAEGEYTPTGHYHDAGPMWSTGYHTGEDYAAPVGTDVVAAGSGTVVEVTYNDGSYGNRVVIEHENGYYTTYNHLSDIDVSVGQEVTAGDKIGEVGATGNASGAHLHFEVTHNGDGWSSGEFVDPHAWLEGDVG